MGVHYLVTREFATLQKKMHRILASSYNVGVTVLMATSLRPNTKTSLSDTKHYRSFFIMTVGQRWRNGSLLRRDRAEATLAVLGETNRFFPLEGISSIPVRHFLRSMWHVECADVENGDVSWFLMRCFTSSSGDEGSMTILAIAIGLFSTFSLQQIAFSGHTLLALCFINFVGRL